MSPIKLFSCKSPLVLSAFAILGLNSCDIDYAGFAQNSLKDKSAIMPTNIWISEALEQIDALDKTRASYIVFKDFGQNVGTSKLYFYEDNSLGKVSFLNDSVEVDEMYFENGKLIFSTHNHENSGVPYIIAYANKKPYAAAIKENDNQWKAATPSDLQTDLAFIDRTSTLAILAEAKEKTPDFIYRISSLSDTITRQLAPSLNEQFVINVIEGDPIQLYLESESEDVFFTLGPKDGVNMERRNWKGNASETGDLLITVFSTTTITKDYTLIVQRLVDKPQLSLQSVGQNR